jgi:hypothetical protein
MDSMGFGVKRQNPWICETGGRPNQNAWRSGFAGGERGNPEGENPQGRGFSPAQGIEAEQNPQGFC